MFDIFSNRQKRDTQQPASIYIYDNLPDPLRAQIIFILDDISGCSGFRIGNPEVIFGTIRNALCEEYGVFQLIETGRSNTRQEVYEFFLNERDVTKCFDVIEMTFKCCIQQAQGGVYGPDYDAFERIRVGAEKLNARLQEHCIGYEFRDAKIIRIDSAFLHKEAVSPAMVLLHEPYLSGANQEFLKGHEHFRRGRLGESINECLKAFESTMKAICHKRRWPYNQTDTAKTLLAACEKNGLFPPYMQSSLSGLRSVLENVATVRNKLSGHGQGAQQIQISEEVAAFVIHSTGANILLLSSLEKKLR